jgi:hypothetical protein
VPGSVVDDDADVDDGFASASLSASVKGQRPKHKQHQQVKKMGSADTRRSEGHS